MADQLTSSDVGAPARAKINVAIQQINTLAAQSPFSQQAIEALLTASNSHGNALTALQAQGLSASQAIAALLDANSSYAQALTELQANDGALDVLVGSLESLTDAHGKAITAEQSRAATAEALARIIAAPKYSVPLDTITLPKGGAVYWNGSTSTGAGETSGGLRVPQGQTGIFSQLRTRFQPTAAQRTKLAGRPVQFMVAFRSTVGALTALRDSAGFSTLGGVIEGVPSIVGVKIYSIRPDLWLAVGDAVLTGNENVITIALQVSGNTLPVAADVSFVAIGAMFMPVDATGTSDVLADFVQPLALRADNLIAAARIRYAPLLGAGPGVTDRALVIPAGQSGAGSLAIYGAPVAGLQAGTRVRCRFAIQVAGGAFVLNGVAQSDPPVTLIERFGATVEMTDGSQVGAVSDLTATSPTTYEASVTFTATGNERIAEFYLKVDENSAVRLTEGQIRLGQMFVDVLSTEPTTTVAAQTARLTESFRAFIAAAPDRFRDWCSASSLSDGDYGTIREAVTAMRTGGSQDQPNRVVVLPGTYASECATGVSINPADYVEIVGKGARRDVEIIARLPDNQAAQDSQQPILLTRSGRLSGLTVRGRNVKYPGHLEAGNAPVAAIWDIDDCEFVHEGATGWTETSALGVGQNDGSKLTVTGSTFLSPTSGVGIHNNTAWARGALATLTGCSLIGTGDSATSLAVTSQGAGVMSAVNLRGCVLSGRIHHYVSFLPGTPLSAYRGAPWEYTVRITDSDPVDWLSPCPFDVLTLTSVAAGNSAAAVGNTGAVRLFGRRPDVRAGAADYAARLHSSHLVSVPEGQFDPGVGLGARLGDMRGAAARPLDIFWDGSSTPVTITLDQNYSSMTNAQVLASLNGKLSAAMGGNTGGRAFSLSQPYHNRAPIRQPDREATAVNAGTATILKGHVLSWTGRRVRLRTSTDAASAFAGIALDDAVPGRSVRFLKTGLIGQAHLLFDGDQTFTAGARYQISATNPGRLVPGADLPVLAVRSVEAYGAALEIIGTVAFTGSATEAVRDAFAAITYRDVPGLPAVIETVVPKGAVGAEPVTLGGVTDTVANRLGALQAGQSSGSLIYDTLAQLNANLTPPDGSTAQVVNDGASTGFYAKSGAPGTGSWRLASTATVPGLANQIAGYGGSGIAVAVPAIEDWDLLTLDAAGRIAEGRKRDGTEWRVINGALTRWVAPLPRDASGLYDLSDVRFSGAFIPPPDLGLGIAVPGIASWREMEVDAAGAFTWGRALDGSEWRSQNGVIVQVSGAVTVAVPTYDFKTTTGRHLLSSAANTDYLVLLVGQSWAEGASFDSGDATVTTVAQHPGAALMFDVGANPDRRIVNGYVDLVEAPYLTKSKETPLSGMADVIMTRLQADLGRKPRIVFAVAARGGTAYYGGQTGQADLGIKRGSVIYAEGLRLIAQAKRISALAGRKLEVLCVVVHHGEQDHSDGLPRSLYGRALDQYQAAYEEDARAITGQTNRVRMYVTQTNRGTGGVTAPPSEPSLAQLAAEDRNPLIRCVGPAYQSPGSDDFAHLKARGFRWLGCLDGHFIANDLFGAYEQPLRVIERWWTSSTVFCLRYSKPVAIEADDSRIKISTLGPGKGITFADGSGAPPTVAGVALASGSTDTIEVTLSAAPSGKRPRAFVAAYTPEGGSGALRGIRSGIRAATPFWSDGPTATDLYQWACHEALDLPVI